MGCGSSAAAKPDEAGEAGDGAPPEEGAEGQPATEDAEDEATKPAEEPLGVTFDDILTALRGLREQFGAAADEPDPEIQGKMTKEELLRTTDYDYLFKQVLGFAALAEHGAEIQELNNGMRYMENPGTQKVEELCGFTMHGNREGANSVIASAPEVMLRAFAAARNSGATDEAFFRDAFDREADPCLEGRLGRLLAYIEKHAKGDDALNAGDGPPWEDVSVDPIRPGSPPETLVGEYLRVFTNLCTWEWAKASSLTYEQAKHLWESACMGQTQKGDKVPNIAKLCNASKFLVYLGEQGVMEDQDPQDGGPPPKCRFSRAEIEQAVNFFVEMETLGKG